MIIKPKCLAGPMAGTNNLVNENPVKYSRRRFVQGVAAGSGLLTTGLGSTVRAERQALGWYFEPRLR